MPRRVVFSSTMDSTSHSGSLLASPDSEGRRDDVPLPSPDIARARRGAVWRKAWVDAARAGRSQNLILFSRRNAAPGPAGVVEPPKSPTPGGGGCAKVGDGQKIEDQAAQTAQRRLRHGSAPSPPRHPWLPNDARPSRQPRVRANPSRCPTSAVPPYFGRGRLHWAAKAHGPPSRTSRRRKGLAGHETSANKLRDGADAAASTCRALLKEGNDVLESFTPAQVRSSPRAQITQALRKFEGARRVAALPAARGRADARAAGARAHCDRAFQARRPADVRHAVRAGARAL